MSRASTSDKIAVALAFVYDIIRGKNWTLIDASQSKNRRPVTVSSNMRTFI